MGRYLCCLRRGGGGGFRACVSACARVREGRRERFSFMLIWASRLGQLNNIESMRERVILLIYSTTITLYMCLTSLFLFNYDIFVFD